MTSSKFGERLGLHSSTPGRALNLNASPETVKKAEQNRWAGLRWRCVWPFEISAPIRGAAMVYYKSDAKCGSKVELLNAW